MTRKPKHDESGDSEDLQALFDEIAGTSSVKPSPGPAVPTLDDESGDSDDLQALFDSVASAADEQIPEKKPNTSAASVSAEDEVLVFNRIGVMTRQVHESLRTLIGETPLKEAVEAIPDARQRLNYIALMTEQAASRVLNATDIAKPLQSRLEHSASQLHTEWDKVFSNQMSVEGFKALAEKTHSFLAQTRDDSRATNAQLLEIMMAQDFQDLTGQVIKRVVDLAQTLETQLVTLLIEVTPPDKLAIRSESLMNGPVIDPSGRDDVVTSQEQVDDLLDSLGF